MLIGRFGDGGSPAAEAAAREHRGVRVGSIASALFLEPHIGSVGVGFGGGANVRRVDWRTIAESGFGVCLIK